MLRCPACHRQFDHAGFCPFDGSSLQPTQATDPYPLTGDAQSGVARAASSPHTAAYPPVDPRTILSSPMPIVPGRDDDDDDDRGDDRPTTPANCSRVPDPHDPPTQVQLKGSPAHGVVTSAITSEASRRAVADAVVRADSDPPSLRALSASENPSDVLELYRAPRENEYDKLVGQTLDGRYFVEKKIGEGGMGVVFSARHAVIERPLAIKVLKREAMRDTATIRRFVQEAKAASRIGHPNIVDVTDFGTTPDGMTYSVMEFVPGQTLGTALRISAPFPPPRAIRITAQIARALAAAHDKGIVHRDLKPENVFLLDRDGRPDFVKIVDFGIAKVSPPAGKAAEPRLTRAGSVFGTPEYMAPEQAAGRSDTDGRVDVYALGVLLYEMICGRVPHRGDSMVRTLAMQMLDPIEPPSQVRPDLHIPAELEAVILHALVKKREQRYQSMGQLLEALESILPAPVGQSVTGSPVYTLAALPPGADPNLIAAITTRPLPVPGNPPATPVTHPGVEPARASPGRRVKDEPQFTAGDRPVSFDHVFTEELVPARASRWPLLVLFTLLVGAAAIAFALVVKSRRAVVVADLHPDAGVLPPPPDAAVAPDAPADADDDVIAPEPDAGRAPVPVRVPVPVRRNTGPGPIVTPEHAADRYHRGTTTIQVLTRPEGANLYEGTHYRGPGGTQLEEPVGTRLSVTCRQPGYKPGTVEVVFDGKTEVVLCVLQRIKICINNIKNPFDDCELDPSQPSTPATTPP